MQNIILLHGALGYSDDLNPLQELLKTPDLSTHSFSFSGHRQTPFKNEFGIKQFASELEEFITEKNLRDVCIFGYSMGGFVALQLASQNPGLIQKIITLGTKFNWNEESVQKETRMLNPAVIQEKVPAFAKTLEAKHGPQWKELLIRTAEMMKEIGKLELLNGDDLKMVTIPVLLGLADKDQMVSLEETTSVFKTLPNAAMYMLPTSKHPLESVNTELLAKITSDFIFRK